MGGSPPGSAGVPPAQHWQSLAHLLDPDRPAKAPGLCLGRAHAVPTGTVDGCAIAGKLSDNPRERMRAGRPRSRVGRFRHDCPSRESRRKRTGWMVTLNPELTITWCPSVESRGGAPALDRGSRCCRRLSPLAGASISVLAAFPRPRSSNRTCGFPASGFQSRSCLRPRMALWLRPQASESIGFP